MTDFQALLAVDKQGAIDFFLRSLKDEVAEGGVRMDELYYVASVLASFAQTSRYDLGSMPAPIDLGEIHDRFVLQSVEYADCEIWEIAGSQTLYVNGVLRNQMRVRHNVHYFDKLGQTFYARAADLSGDRKKEDLLRRMSFSLPTWTRSTSKMSRTLSENQLLLRLD